MTKEKALWLIAVADEDDMYDLADMLDDTEIGNDPEVLSALCAKH